jgi:hypothetical protein
MKIRGFSSLFRKGVGHQWRRKAYILVSIQYEVNFKVRTLGESIFVKSCEGADSMFLKDISIEVLLLCSLLCPG